MGDRDDYNAMSRGDLVNMLKTLKLEVQRERAAKEAAEEAVRIVGGATNAKFPWRVVLPYLKMRCKVQHLFVSNQLV